MDPRHFLTVAETLLASRVGRVPSDPLGEAECRSAISRAYYAAFLAAHECLAWIGVRVLENPKCHDGVMKALNNSKHTVLVTIGQTLNTLGQHRRDADYKMSLADAGTPELTDHAIGIARQAIQFLDIIRQGKCTPFDPAAVTNTILSWAATNGQDNIQRR